MDRVLETGDAKPKRRRSGTSVIRAVEDIDVPVTAQRLKAYRAWDRRRQDLDLPVWQAAEFADAWLPALVDEWLEEAQPLGWQPSARRPWGSDRCRDDSQIVTHLAASDGWHVHLLLEQAPRSVVLRTKRYWKTSPDSHWETTYTDDDRLTTEELQAGEMCRGCGRPFLGGPERVPPLYETDKQRVAREAEDAAFQELHADCHAMRWTLSGGGVQHCSRCCAPPPIAPDTLNRVARILIDSARRHDELVRR
jgi:hypothetical protein